MNLDELQSIRDRERQSDSLQQLREDFYVDVGEFVRELREERDAVAKRADDPFDAPEVNRLTDDINTAEQTVEAIYERRVGKLVKMASFAAADMPTEDEGLTAEERQLFERMVAAIEDNRDTVMAVIDGADTPAKGAADSGLDAGPPTETEPTADPAGTRTGPPAEESTAEPAEQSGVDAADLMAGADETPSEPETDAPPEASPDPTETHDPAPAGAGATADADQDANPAPSTRETGTESGQPAAEEPIPPDVREDEPSTGSPSTAPESPQATGTDAPGGAEPTTSGGAGTDAPGAVGTDSAEAATAEGETGDEVGRSAGGGGVGVDRETVRITDDVGRIFGVDEREYELTQEDVVTLPSENAAPLVERDVAERLDRTGN